MYPPQERIPEARREDEGFFSFDRTRKLIVLRQFHVEGFVKQYLQQSTSSPPCCRDGIDREHLSGLASPRKRTPSMGDELEEVFELAPPGKPFELYSRARLQRDTTRKRSLAETQRLSDGGQPPPDFSEGWRREWDSNPR